MNKRQTKKYAKKIAVLFDDLYRMREFAYSVMSMVHPPTWTGLNTAERYVRIIPEEVKQLKRNSRKGQCRIWEAQLAAFMLTK